MKNLVLNHLPVHLNSTNSCLGITAVIIFILSYIFVILEEVIELRKSKPVLLAAGIIWIIVGFLANKQHLSEFTNLAIKNNILEYAELLLFLIVAMTYINAMTDRKIFEALRAWLINKRFSFKKLFWITGFLAFFISPIADNLTTALVMSAIVIAVAPNHRKFISCSCINIVIAANAGGAFSPFGDLTTLMVWQNNKLKFLEFFRLFIPALVSYLVPACCLSLGIENNKPSYQVVEPYLKRGAKRILLLFVLTIVLAIVSNHLLNLPAVFGMMLGLSLLGVFGFYLKKTKDFFDFFSQIQNIEWDTLLFFYGVILSIGGLYAIGYLDKASSLMYNANSLFPGIIHQHTLANIFIGICSAVLDNIPLMFAVISMDPEMVKGQWLLVTLTLGIGGSLLSIGSAAGVALMGQTKGIYSFSAHLKWSWAILLGYVFAIYIHLLINHNLFNF